MAITARLSHKLHQTLVMKPLNELNFSRVDARFAEARQATQADLAELRHAMQADLAQLRQEMKAGFAEIRQEMAHLETRLERRVGDLIKWSFVFWVGAVGAIAMLAGVLR